MSVHDQDMHAHIAGILACTKLNLACSLNLLLLTLGACVSEGYSSWVCVCVCLSRENKLLRSLTPVICSAYSIILLLHVNARFKTCGFC